MFLKGWACFLFLDPQDEVGPCISSSVVLRSFVLLVYIVVLVLVVCLCPSSVHVVATFSATVLFPLLCSTHTHTHIKKYLICYQEGEKGNGIFLVH